MSSFRRHLKLWAAAWLICQALGLSALVPRHCCLAHEPAAQANPEAEDEICPLHQAAAAHAQPDPACELRSTCAGPLAAVLAMLSAHAVLPDLLVVEAGASPRSFVRAPAERLLSALAAVDPPPPRS
jgi:hypothetical protein